MSRSKGTRKIQREDTKDSVARYMNEISEFDLLSPDEEKQIGALALAGAKAEKRADQVNAMLEALNEEEDALREEIEDLESTLEEIRNGGVAAVLSEDEEEGEEEGEAASVNADPVALELEITQKRARLTEIPEKRAELIEEWSSLQPTIEVGREHQDILVERNLRFVVNVAKRYQNSGLPLPDLIQAGNEGLIKASRKFDPARNVRFVSYASYWIIQQIQKQIDVEAGTVRATQTQMVRVRRVRKLQAEAEREGRPLDLDAIAQETGYTIDRIDEALNYNPTILSLDAPVDPSDTHSAPLGHMIGDEDRFVEAELERERGNAIARVIDAVCDEREATILRLYYGIGGIEPWPLTEIGKALGISRERARQLKERATQNIRNSPMAATLLEVFQPAEGDVNVPEEVESGV